jgi:hypothetical protein
MANEKLVASGVTLRDAEWKPDRLMVMPRALVLLHLFKFLINNNLTSFNLVHI